MKIELFHDNFQNYKVYGIPKAQLVIADIPYNIGANAYGSSPEWYVGGDNSNGESKKAKAQFFSTDNNFNLVEYMHFCGKMLVKEPKERNKAPAMIIFCSFQQQHFLIETAKKYGFPNYIPLTFIKNTSAQVLKANMRIVGATEHALVFYRDKLPKFNNVGEDGRKHMIYDWFNWTRDKSMPKIHPTQKPVPVLQELIKIFTDPGDVVIDPVAGSGSTLIAAARLGRHAYGFECEREFYNKAKEAIEKETEQLAKEAIEKETEQLTLDLNSLMQ